MNADRHKKPLIPMGWLRALLFICAYLVLLLLLALALVPILLKTDLATRPTLLFYIQFICNAVVAMLVLWVFRTFVDRRSVMSLGFSWTGNGANAGAGFFTGILLACAGTLLMAWTGYLEWTGSVFNANDQFISLGLMVIVALYEEAIFRGYILNNLMDSYNKWLALLISSLLFMVGHFGNQGITLVGALNILVAGLLLGCNYIYTRNLWFGIFLHFSWNFFQGPILGYEVSGVHLQSLFQHDVKGSTLITGGSFGLEGSIIGLVLFILTTAAFVFVYERKYKPIVVPA
ncbi:MAG: CPBP family intramembrane metalloprotease [Bacteroidetes bacterium]|nr:CPBP family intramembrane metalloprotease [Bacteroidota bacterium]